MKRFAIVLLLMYSLSVITNELWAQELDSNKANQSSLPQPPPYIHVPPTERVSFTWAEQMPVYPGGNDALTRFIAENTVYPATATKTGKVFISFWVTREGGIDSARVEKGLEPVLDAEAVRVVNLLGKFVPGAKSGRPVAIPFSITVNFPPVLPEPKKYWKRHKR